MENLIIEGLTKTYKGRSRPALSDFSYDFDHGVYGLLGPNGAGKSTLMNIIVGNVRPDKGKIIYQNTLIKKPTAAFRDHLGFMPQQQQLYKGFTIARFLFYFAALKGLDSKTARGRIEELLHVVGLEAMADQKLSSLSGGMKQRVLLAQALLNDPDLLLLDEPTAGLDPKERIRVRNYLHSISENKTIILATHVISDIEQIAKEVIFLKEGETVKAGSPAKVMESIADMFWEAETTRDHLRELTQKYPQNHTIGEREGKIWLKIISDQQPDVPGVNKASVNLEDVFDYLY